MTKMLGSLFLAAALAACAAGNETVEAPSPAAANAATSASPDDLRTTCVSTFARQRECTEQFLPALVDARIRVDKPAGIAARAQQPGGRDSLLAEAHTEWAEDSKPEAAAATCDQIVGRLPNDAIESALRDAQACLGESSCDPFVRCLEPILARTMR